MRFDNRMWVITLLGLIVLSLVGFLGSQAASAQPTTLAEAGPFNMVQMGSTNYGLDWNVVGMGGGEIASTHYQIRSTIGQPAIGRVDSTHFGNHAGYWQNFTYKIFLPLVLRNY